MFDVLAAARDEEQLSGLERTLRQHGVISVRTRRLTDTRPDPLAGEDQLPELLVLGLHSGSTAELELLDARPATERPMTLVIGPEGDLELMRQAMRAGARDFFADPPQSEELLAAVDRAIKERQSQLGSARKQLTVVVNASGGAGASFIATNVAHILATHFKSKTTLIDMDLQFGSLGSNFSVQPDDGLQHALGSIETLDSVALEGWATHHQSGVHLFGCTHRQLLLPRDFTEDQIARFLNLVRKTYSHAVLDVPRHVDHVFATCLQEADSVAVVMQQSLAHLRDAKTLLRILQQELLLSSEQISVVVNRWQKKAVVSVKDIEKGLRTPHVVTIANEFQTVLQSLNLGSPVYEVNPRAPITRDLIGLSSLLGGVALPKKTFLQRILSGG